MDVNVEMQDAKRSDVQKSEWDPYDEVYNIGLYTFSLACEKELGEAKADRRCCDRETVGCYFYGRSTTSSGIIRFDISGDIVVFNVLIPVEVRTKISDIDGMCVRVRHEG